MTTADKLAALNDRGYGYDQLIRLGNLRGQYSLEGAVTALYEEFVHPDLAGDTLDSTREGSQDDFSCLPVEARKAATENRGSQLQARDTDFDDVEDAVL